MMMFTYLFRRSFSGVVGLLIALSVLIILIDLIESLNTVADYEGGGFFEALLLTLMRTPTIAVTLLPFTFLFGCMIAFSGLNRKSEIAVMRSAGMSIWRIIAPSLMLAFVAGILTFMVFDPVASNLSGRSETFQDEMRGSKSSFLTELSNEKQGNIWLNQVSDDVSVVLRARNYDAEKQVLSDVTIFRRDLLGRFIDRWDADFAELKDKNFVLHNANRMTLDINEKEFRKEYKLPTPYSLKDLTSDIVKPETMSIWMLPEFIDLAKGAGLSSVKYELRVHTLITMPLKLIGMVIIAACFSFSPVRNGGTARLILAGIVSGFILYILTEVSTATAEANIVSVVIASWFPIVIALLASLTILMINEDG